MKTRIKRVLTRMVSVGVVALILLFLIEAPASAFTGSGAGTPADPYQITNCAELQDMKNNLTAHYVLMNDIDCYDATHEGGSLWNDGAGFEPVGWGISPFNKNPFTGTFDGQNHTITGLYINRPTTDYVGLFGCALSLYGCTPGVNCGEIKNVGLVDVDITGYDLVGGLVGYNHGTITNSYATGSVTGRGFVGGLAGYTDGGTISNSYSTGNVNGTGWRIGGLVGYNHGKITNSYATGNVISTGGYAGGLVGLNGYRGCGGTITNSYSTGSVTGNERVGGLAGGNDGTITNCYYNNHAGNPGTCVYFGSSTGCTAIDDNESYFYYSTNPPMSSWDFVNVWSERTNDFPHLKWEPIKITTCAELQDMNLDLAAHYVLMNDIDCSDTVNWNSGAGFEPIGNSINPFIGTFDGQGHIITALFINRPNTVCVGLFGYIKSVEISNVGLEDVDITGYHYAGGLVGWNYYGAVTNSYATGSVTGNEYACPEYIGGLVGLNDRGNITNSYATGSVSGGSFVGGLVGWNWYGAVTNSYATGSVNGNMCVGGLVGWNYYGAVTNSYATGSVSGNYYAGGLVGFNRSASISNCYYNNHAENPSVGIGSGSGDCTAIDNDESYFYYSSNPPMNVWDFVNIWGIDEGVSYPYLLWQIPPNQPPIANAGADQAVHPGGVVVVTLDGSGSSDPEGNYPLTYFWQITSMPEASTAELFDADTVNPSFFADMLGDYIIELVVTDSLGAESAPDEVLVSTYNTPPVADAGPDQAIIELYTTVQLDGSKSYDDEGDDFTYLWTITQKPAESLAELDDPSSATPTFVADVQGDYVISLVVTDIFGAVSEPDTMTVSFENVPPVADAGGNQSVIAGDTVFLDGSGSYDGNGDPLSYSWSFVSKPSGSLAELSDASIVDPSFIADEPGEYVVSLVVNDGFVNSAPDNVTIMAITSQDAAAMTLVETVDTVNALAPESLKNRNLKNALTNKINAVLNKIVRGFYDEALDKLQNDILQKTNGCADTGQPDRNDWITTCEEQGQVYPLIIEAIELLENLI